jgi:hypothetical protein
MTVRRIPSPLRRLCCRGVLPGEQPAGREACRTCALGRPVHVIEELTEPLFAHRLLMGRISDLGRREPLAIRLLTGHPDRASMTKWTFCTEFRLLEPCSLMAGRWQQRAETPTPGETLHRNTSPGKRVELARLLHHRLQAPCIASKSCRTNTCGPSRHFGAVGRRTPKGPSIAEAIAHRPSMRPGLARGSALTVMPLRT